MHQLTNVRRQHAPTAARWDRQAWHEHTRMDDTARELLGTTCTQHNQTKCMRVLLAENVSETPTNVGRDPQGGNRVASATVRKAGTPRATVRREPAREAREGRK